VVQVRGNAVFVDGVDELERPQERSVTALDLVVAPRRGFRAVAGTNAPDRQPVVLDGQVDLVAREARHLGRDHVARGRFVDVDRRGPGAPPPRGGGVPPVPPSAAGAPRGPGHTPDRSTCLCYA